MAGRYHEKFPRGRPGGWGLGQPPPVDSGPGKDQPLPCVAFMWAPDPQEADKLRNALKPITQTIDPDFNLLSIGDYWSRNGHLDSEVILNHIQRMEDKTNKNGGVNLKTPSLSFVMMLKEDHPFEGLKSHQVFKDLPWKFHHKIELSNTKGQKIQSIAKQEFYQPGPGLPLWAICPVHFGNQHLRYTIFTCNFSAMMDFYRILTGKEVEHVKANFCLFELFTVRETTVQLALKQSTQLQPSPCRTAALCFRVHSTDYLGTLLGISPEKITDTLFSVSDPDGNCLLIEQVKNNNSSSDNLVLQKNKTTVTRNKTIGLPNGFKMPRGSLSFGELWSETSSFDSGQHSSSFSSMMDSTLSEDVDSCISSDIDSSEFDSPLWPHSFNVTLGSHHQMGMHEDGNTTLTSHHHRGLSDDGNITFKSHHQRGLSENGNITFKSHHQRGLSENGKSHQMGLNETATSRHQRELHEGRSRVMENKWENFKESGKHASKTCKPWELSCEHDNWFDTLTAASSCFEQKLNFKHETPVRNARTLGADPSTISRRGHFI